MIDLSKIGTEQQNENTMKIDQLNTLEMVRLINQEDQAVIDAVNNASESIANAVDATYEVISQGGRLVYIGAGTSGRIGVLDASEWLPTFGVGEESVVGIIAGGDHALRHPIESAEDNEQDVIDDLKAINFNKDDILCALASSGRTPYCIGGLKYANDLGAKTISLACVANSELANYADYPIEAVVGQEVVTGSTRMKSGSAQKMVLNIISTSVMIKSGKVYGNLMVDVKPTNKKLVERAKGIIMKASGCSYERAEELMELSQGQVKPSIVMEKLNIDFTTAEALLANNHGRIADALNTIKDR
ncbi:N-acetylmuramic acid 6-phosphate etherase [Erysipelothrix urinaevulpis]|uniref:N-acetylmuramic acid 6-phosphate etherase n=1 Tax=Erysipelothrix urinaevulpis TaxID=2683717 RepID=UPI00135A43AC|nr:N-acetylmuramic acid 6-phosphate etherase [Erysipelothrix urinaevulpis]